MALWVCAGPEGCGTKYAVGLFTCPRCHNTEFFEDGDPMAKISRHSGASDKTLPENAAAAETVPAFEAAADQPGRVTEPLDVTEHLAGPSEPVEVGGERGPEPVEAEVDEEPSPEDNSSPPAQEPGQDYEAWTVEQMKEQLGARGLPKSGKRDDLVLRLLEDDDTRTAGNETE